MFTTWKDLMKLGTKFNKKFQQQPTGTYYPLGAMGTVPRAYEGMKGRKNEYKEIKNRKIK
jgi:hypothetical protein